MSDTIFDDNDKSIVVAHIKDFIKGNEGKKGNGYVSVAFAVTDIIKNKNYDPEHPDKHKEAFINSVSAMLVNTGEFVREKNGIDYDILLNPGFYFNKSIKRASLNTRIIALLAALISLLTFITNLSKSDISPAPQLKELNTQLQKQEKALIELNTSLEKIRLSIEKAKKDSARNHE